MSLLIDTGNYFIGIIISNYYNMEDYYGFARWTDIITRILMEEEEKERRGVRMRCTSWGDTTTC